MNNITRGLGGQDAVAGQKRGTKMAMVKASLTLFGGDTLVVRCSERCHIHLMSAKVPGDSHADILSVPGVRFMTNLMQSLYLQIAPEK